MTKLTLLVSPQKYIQHDLYLRDVEVSDHLHASAESKAPQCPTAGHTASLNYPTYLALPVAIT
jgi:hypothetical protein